MPGRGFVSAAALIAIALACLTVTRKLERERRLLAKLRAERGLSLLYITHDLLSARVVTDEILVLHEGRVVESGVTKDVLQHPKDEYTVQLLDAIPNPFAESGEVKAVAS